MSLPTDIVIESTTDLTSFDLDKETEKKKFAIKLEELEKKALKQLEAKHKQVEAVVHPKHYNIGKHEVIDIIHDWKLGFNTGNAIKYIARAGHKDPNKHVEDLKKAIFYLNDEIRRVSEQKNSEESKQLEMFPLVEPSK